MPADPLGVSGFLAQALNEGWSGTRTLGELRDAGLGMRTQTFFRMWGEVSAAVANRDELLALDATQSLRPEHFTDWSAGNDGNFLYQVDVVARDSEFGQIVTVPYSFTSDRMLTPSEIIDSATDLYGDAAEDYGQVVLAGMLTGAYRMGQR